MSKQETLARHRIIIQKLRSKPSSFEEIQEPRIRIRASRNEFPNL